MASHVRQVKGDDPDKKEYPGPPRWGLGVRITISPRKKYVCWEASNIVNQTKRKKQRRHSMSKDIRVEIWKVPSVYRSGTLQNLNIRLIY
jgi:hypothetical protein